MKAIVRTEYGGTERVRLDDRPEPRPAAGEVLVEVHAAGVDRGVWHVMTGRPWMARPVFGVRRPKVPELGRDLAGVVTALGEGVTGFAVGDRVMGTSAHGTFAEQVAARADRIVPLPDRWGFVEAAAVPVSGLTAMQAVHRFGQVRSGQRVLVIGGSGGVGSFTVQLARHAGALVDAEASAAKAELVRGLGTERVWTYDGDQADRVDSAPHEPYDVVIDCGSYRSLRQLRRLVKRRGTVVIVGAETGGPLMDGFQRQLRAAVVSPFVSQRLTFVVSSEAASELAQVVALAEDGGFEPVVERTYPLVDAAAAIDHVTDGRARGKVVVRVRD
jgi:NADPH:quinone reductase-like Zn-dependent oxidoreductase